MFAASIVGCERQSPTTSQGTTSDSPPHADAEDNMPEFYSMRESGDALMRSGDYQSANDSYHAAWDCYAAERQHAADRGDVQQFDEQYLSKDAFWLLLSGANAQFCLGDFDGTLDTGTTAFNLFKDIGCVVGNPFFHLRIGQAGFEVEQPGDRDQKSMSIDNLARALICGGIEIFAKEDPKYLNPVLGVLRPPAGFDSWESAAGQGCSVDQLNGASGFLAEVFETKYGAPPPYPAA